MTTETLGKYEIRSVLGKGAMGTVYAAWDPIISRQVAIKTVRLPDAADIDAQEELHRFKREAQAAGRLTHPNIVGIYDYGESDQVAYIVMEFVDGRTLKHVLDGGERMPLEMIVRVMGDLLAGLSFSHARGVVHRDIKPANIMIVGGEGQGAGQAKIADFGIARIESSNLTQAGTIMGTPAYMSPEQFMGQTVDARSDIYSAGVLLFQMLTGERPFEGSMASIMHKALNTEPPRPSDLSVNAPRALDQVVAQAMARRPEDRFATADAFAAAIREAAAAKPAAPLPPRDEVDDEATVVQSAPKPATPRPQTAPVAAADPPRPRSKTLLLAGIAVVVLAGLGGGAYVVLGPSAPAVAPERTAAVVPPADTRATPSPPDPSPVTRSAAAGAPLSAPDTPNPPPPPATSRPNARALPPITQATSSPPPSATTTAPTQATSTSEPAATSASRAPPPTADTPPLATATIAPPPETQPNTAPITTAPIPTPSATTPPIATPPSTTTPSTTTPSTTTPTSTIAAATTPAVTPPADPGVARPAEVIPPVTTAPSRVAAVVSPEAMRRAVSATVRSADCAVISGNFASGGTLSLQGAIVAGAPAQAFLREVRDAAPSATLDWTVGELTGPYCGPLNAVRAYARPFGATGSSVAVGLKDGRTDLVEDNDIDVRATAPSFPSYMQIDYYQNDGTVAHLRTASADSPALPAGSTQQFVAGQVANPFGTDLIVAVASSTPLFAKDQALPDTASDYLRVLQTALDAARAKKASLSANVLVVKTRPKG